MMQKNKKTLMMTGVLLAAGVIAAQAQVGPIYSGDVNYTGTAHLFRGCKLHRYGAWIIYV